MERHDNHTISQDASGMKVRLFHSIRLRIFLLVIIPMIFCAFSIAVLANVSIHATKDMQKTVNTQSLLYRGLSLPNILCNQLNDYLSTGKAEELQEYEVIRDEFFQFIQLIKDGGFTQPYSSSMANMGTNLLRATDEAIHEMNNPSRMLSAYQEATSITDMISAFSPYVTREIESEATAQIKAVADHVDDSVRSDVLVLVVILFLLIVAAALLATSITKPLTALTKAVRTTSISTSSPALSKTKRQDELGILIRAYRDMVKRIHMQLNELEDKQRIERMLQQEKERNLETESMLARSELKVYQSQINSHFLFNAFNSVSRLAYIENAPQVQHAVTLIAQFLRNILTQFDRTVTIEEEFSIVNNFIEIQNLRFGDRIKVESVMDAGTEWFTIPALTLQPLVENAYRHGVTDRKEGFIRCVAEIEGAYLKLYTWDDGKGISEDRQQAIRRYIVEDGENDLFAENIGLKNIFRRLQLMYPDRIEVLIDSVEGVYTQIGFAIKLDADLTV